MNKKIKLLVATAICFGCAYFSKTSANQKTFLMPRPHLANMAMEYTTWHEQAYRPAKNDFHSHVQLTPFYQAAVKGSDVGKHFALGNRNYFEVETGKDIDPLNLGLAGGTKCKITLNPKQEVYGARIDYFQNFNTPIKKLYFKISAPITHVENDLHARFEDTSDAAYKGNVEKFFTGQFDGSKEEQRKLTHAKIAARSLEATGVGDIDVSLGYKLIESDNHHIFFNGAITIPTGTKPRSVYLWEPVYGNGHHFAAGAGLDVSLKLWENNKHCARFVAALNYRYLFEGTEARTLGQNHIDRTFVHYFRLEDTIDSKHVSAANVLTQNVSVRPGNMWEGLLNFAFTSSKFILDVGYNIFNKQGESVSIKKLEASDKKIKIEGTADETISDRHLNLSIASTPSQLTHKIYAGLGYTFEMYKKYPSALGLGASYEFAPSNHELEGYAFWGKASVSF